METHRVALKVPADLAVGNADLELAIRRNGRKVATFTVNATGVSWNPATSKAATSVSWEEVPATLAGKPGAAPSAAAPAAVAASAPASVKQVTGRKTAKKATPIGKTAAAPEPTEAQTPAEVTAETPADTVAEMPTPAAAPVVRKTAKKASSAKKSAVLDARAVRAWAGENGIVIGPRGPIAARILEQFRAANA